MHSKFTRTEIGKLIRSNQIVIRNSSLDIRATKIECDKAADNLGRILIITSRKVGNAVKRNKIRRRIKAIFYENNLYKIQFDIVIFCKPSIVSLSFLELKDLILKLIEKIIHTSILKSDIF